MTSVDRYCLFYGLVNLYLSIVDGPKIKLQSPQGLPSYTVECDVMSIHVLQIKATDNGNPQLWSTTRLHIDWIRKPLPSTSPLLFKAPYYNFSITESAKVSESVGTISVHQNNIPLWFDITGGLGHSHVFKG